MTRPIDEFAVVVPARRDPVNARATVRRLLAEADASERAVTIVLVDNGENDAISADLPDDERLVVVEEPTPGPGYARSAGVAEVAARVASSGRDASRCWLISLDADVVVAPGYFTSWFEQASQQAADILDAPAPLGQLPGEPRLSETFEAAGSWLWSDTALYEALVGVVNVGGTHHGVSLATCIANGSYLQPTALIDGRVAVVPGEDWDFGLRARMAGLTIVRTPRPVVVASSRRFSADPIGFLTGRSYERPFEPIRDQRASDALPADEPWVTVARRGRTRLAAHFLLKPLLAGIPASAALSWFLGTELVDEIAELGTRAPKPDTDWAAYRAELVDFLFGREASTLCGRIAAHVAGARP